MRNRWTRRRVPLLARIKHAISRGQALLAGPPDRTGVRQAVPRRKVHTQLNQRKQWHTFSGHLLTA